MVVRAAHAARPSFTPGVALIAARRRSETAKQPGSFRRNGYPGQALHDHVTEVSVADTEIGIAPENQDAVFEGFRQGVRRVGVSACSPLLVFNAAMPR